jgi:hypothetical protein
MQASQARRIEHGESTVGGAGATPDSLIKALGVIGRRGVFPPTAQPNATRLPKSWQVKHQWLSDPDRLGNSPMNLRPANAVLDCDGVRSEIG